MRRSQLLTVALSGLSLFCSWGATMWAQQEIGFIEKFATSEDRRSALKELIPGTEEFYYYHCLYYQNESSWVNLKQCWTNGSQSSARTPASIKMQARQLLLAYDGAPRPLSTSCAKSCRCNWTMLHLVEIGRLHFQVR